MGVGIDKMIDQKDTLHRLRNIEGHIHGIVKMVERGDYCIDVIHQIQAVQSALKKVSYAILEHHLHTCMITVLRGEDPAERERVLNEIMDVFEATK
jgi:DNA-binding FrmR family transcriptional regulator